MGECHGFGERHSHLAPAFQPVPGCAGCDDLRDALAQPAPAAPLDAMKVTHVCPACGRPTHTVDGPVPAPADGARRCRARDGEGDECGLPYKHDGPHAPHAYPSLAQTDPNKPIPGHTITPECGPICWTTGHHHDPEACDGCRRLMDVAHRSGMSLAAPLDRVCTCGPWQIGQPEGHLDGCPRKALLAAPAAPLDRERLARALHEANCWMRAEYPANNWTDGRADPSAIEVDIANRQADAYEREARP